MHSVIKRPGGQPLRRQLLTAQRGGRRHHAHPQRAPRGPRVPNSGTGQVCAVVCVTPSMWTPARSVFTVFLPHFCLPTGPHRATEEGAAAATSTPTGTRRSKAPRPSLPCTASHHSLQHWGRGVVAGSIGAGTAAQGHVRWTGRASAHSPWSVPSVHPSVHPSIPLFARPPRTPSLRPAKQPTIQPSSHPAIQNMIINMNVMMNMNIN